MPTNVEKAPPGKAPSRKVAPKGRSRVAATSDAPGPAAESVGDDQAEIDGFKIVSDEPMPSPLSTGAGNKPIVFHGFRVLTLTDGSTRYGCGECPNSTDFVGSLAEVRRHRSQRHGMRLGGARKRTGEPPELPGVIPLSLRMMPLGEVLDLAGQLNALGDLFAQLTSDRDEYKERALSAEMQVRRWERAFSSLGLVKED